VNAEFQRFADVELVRLTQEGSLAAFEELVYRYEKRIYAFVLLSCPNAADAQELTQDTFVRTFQAIAQFNSRYEFSTWLFTIARRKCIDRHRRIRPATEELHPELAAGDDPAALVSRAEERNDLWELARRLLPATQYQALWLRYVEEMSLAQVAQALSQSLTHVKVLLFRARRSMGRALKRNHPLSMSGPECPPARTVLTKRAFKPLSLSAINLPTT